MMTEAKRPAHLSGLLSRFVKSFRIREALRELAWSTLVLDLGCGLCELTAKLPRSIRYVGVERDRWMFERAVATFPQHRFICADIEDDGFDPGVRADAIVLLAVWEHLQDPVRLLVRARAWASPDARLILTTPAPGAHALLETGAVIGLLSRHADEEHERLWWIDEIAAAASEAGWRMLKARRFLFGLNQLVVLTRS